MTILEARPAPSGLCEVHVEVQWADDSLGHRFFQVRHDPVPPCVSEAIEASILSAVSKGRHKMTGHATLEGGDVILEVWSNVSCLVSEWSLDIVPL